MDDHKEFDETTNAMRIIGLTQQEQDDIFRLIASILWIGNVQFREDASGNAEIIDPGVTDFVAYLLQVDGAALHKVPTLIHRFKQYRETNRTPVGSFHSHRRNLERWKKRFDL